MYVGRVVILFLTSVCSFPLSAQEETPEVPSPSDKVYFKPGGHSLSLYGGNLSAAEEPQFTDIRNEYTLGFGLSADLEQYSHWAMDVEFFYFNRDFDTPLGPPAWGTLDNDTSVETSAFLFGGRVFYPLEGPFRAYASAGLGYFKTKMVVYGSLFGFPGSYEDSDSSLNFYYGAGMSYKFGSWGLSLDYRHFNLEGSFGSFDVQNANLGGDAFLVGWHFSF